MDLLTIVLTCSAYADNSIINAMVQVNSQGNPLVISGKPFKTENQALAYVSKLDSQGADYKIGLLQIPAHALKHRPVPVSLAQLLRPCKNMIEASQILNYYQYQPDCNGSAVCALSFYQTGDPESGIDYANQIISYASDHPVVRPPPL